VQTFIQQNNGAEDLFFFETRYQDRPWFVVVYGNYPNRSAARQAIEQLPQPLKDLQPWARSLADIQSDIRRYQ
jgi:septal ring-binding cell division protein DamX